MLKGQLENKMSDCLFSLPTISNEHKKTYYHRENKEYDSPLIFLIDIENDCMKQIKRQSSYDNKA